MNPELQNYLTQCLRIVKEETKAEEEERRKKGVPPPEELFKYKKEFNLMLVAILDEVFKAPDGTFFDSITLAVTPNLPEISAETTITSERLRPDCLYAAL